MTLASPENELEEYFKGSPHCGSGATSGLTARDAEAVEAILKVYDLSDQITLDKSKLKSSCEAWLHVKVFELPMRSLFEGFSPYPRKGVLTWANGD